MPDEPTNAPITGYFRTSESAKASLIFVLPLVIIYELGTWYFTFDPKSHTEQRIVAFSLLRDWLGALGATARWVAPASVISALGGLMLLRRERVKVRLGTLAGMTVESVALAAPVLLMSMLVARIPLLANGESIGSGVVLSIGAGIYEELVFRLIGLAVLHFILADFLSIRASVALPLMILISSVGFSLYHYWGPEHFAAQTFVFRTLAGAYFAILLIYRGFGITAGCHASYDILIIILRAMSHVEK